MDDAHTTLYRLHISMRDKKFNEITLDTMVAVVTKVNFNLAQKMWRFVEKRNYSEEIFKAKLLHAAIYYLMFGFNGHISIINFY